MFLGHQDQNIVSGIKKKPKYDNYSMKTYIFRDLESNGSDEKPQTTGVYGDLTNILILLLLYTIQGAELHTCLLSLSYRDPNVINRLLSCRHTDWSQRQCSSVNERKGCELFKLILIFHGFDSFLH